MYSAIGFDAKETSGRGPFEPAGLDEDHILQDRSVGDCARSPAAPVGSIASQPRPHSDSATRSTAVLTSGFPASMRGRKSLGAATIIRAYTVYAGARALAGAFANPTYIPQETHAICGRSHGGMSRRAIDLRGGQWACSCTPALHREGRCGGGGCGGERSTGWARIQAGGARERNGTVRGVMHMAKAAVALDTGQSGSGRRGSDFPGDGLRLRAGMD
ncbi:hypothetical protein C8R44DRAFT_941656 [Mycena epipterygia]|nr:hypothetical protein C8R44DRAFT_941656 [Mycena epipterygia]